jgi:hypothetical protein
MKLALILIFASLPFIPFNMLAAERSDAAPESILDGLKLSIASMEEGGLDVTRRTIVVRGVVVGGQQMVSIVFLNSEPMRRAEPTFIYDPAVGKVIYVLGDRPAKGAPRA